MRRRSALPVLSVLLVLASPAWADDFKGLRYTAPDGWEATDREGVRLLAPEVDEGQLVLAVLYGVQPATGAAPAEQLAEVAAHMNEAAQVQGRSTVATTDKGPGGVLLLQNFDAVSTDLGPHARWVGVLVRGGQRARVLLMARPASLFQERGDDLQVLFQSLALTGPAVPAPKAAALPTASAPSPAPAPAPSGSVSGRLPTGDTPGVFPGSPGWLPSGRGVPLPAPRVVGGKPQGLWWAPQLRSNGQMVAAPIAFLADGTRVATPRPGGGTLLDVEGQRAQRGSTGVGTFTVEGGVLAQAYDGFTNKGAFRSGADGEGPWFSIGAARYRPMNLVTPAALVGHWSGAGSQYTFRADGTYDTGSVSDLGGATLAAGSRGTWQLDGYLLAIRPTGAPGWISIVASSAGALVLNNRLYTKR